MSCVPLLEVSSPPSLHAEAQVVLEPHHWNPFLTSPGTVSCFLLLFPQSCVLNLCILSQFHYGFAYPAHCTVEGSIEILKWVYFQGGSFPCIKFFLKFSASWGTFSIHSWWPLLVVFLLTCSLGEESQWLGSMYFIWFATNSSWYMWDAWSHLEHPQFNQLCFYLRDILGLCVRFYPWQISH